MIPKVKMKMEQDGHYVTYTVTSKSLTAALQRATLLVQALGDTHAVELIHTTYTSKRGRFRHQVEVYVN